MRSIVYSISRSILVFIVAALLLTTATARAATLDGHTVVLDGNGKIIPWTTDPSQGYDEVMNLAWNYLLFSVPSDGKNGQPDYYSYSYLNPDTQQAVDWPHNPAGLYAMLSESALKYYGYSGNIAVVNLAENVATALLDNGRTPSDWDWANVPYASGDAGSLIYQGAAVGNTSGAGDGTYVIEPDKVGEMGYAWLQLYRFDGNARFRDAAIAAADALASHVRVGSATQSPWPFRVYAQTGVVREDYCADVIGPISLFDGLINLGLGNIAAYQTARDTAWNWLMTYPMQTNVWANYFEDVPIQTNGNNVNQYNAMMTARYLLEHPEFDANWESHVRGLITWVKNTFNVPSYGADTIKEQVEFAYPMGSHTSRYASINALLYEKTGDTAARETAYRSLNWATYMARPDGVVIDGPEVNHQWFTDGYGDYIRHFMTSLGAVPEWSPSGRSHLLRSSSIVKNIIYSQLSITYTVADINSMEVVRVNFAPTSVTVDGQALSQRSDLDQAGWTFDPILNVVRIRHDTGTNVQILQTPTVTGTTPTNDTTPTWTWVSGGGGNGTYRFRLDNSDLTAGATTTTYTSYTPGVAQTEGSHTLYVQEGDTTGNWSASGSFTIVIDITVPDAPTITGTTPTNDTTPTWSWVSNEGGNGTYRFRLDNSDLTAGATTTTNTSYTPLVQGEGTHTLYVQERDDAGNWSTSGSLAIVIDITAPDTSITGTPVNPTNQTSASLTFTATETANFECRMDDGGYSACTSPKSYTLAAGSHTFQVRAIDLAGNIDETPATYTWEIDTTVPNAPTVTGTTPTNSTTPTWTWVSGGGNGTYRFRLDNSDLTTGSTATTSTSYTPLALTEGTHTLYVQESDAAGNWSASGSLAIVIDIIAPDTSITSQPSNPTNQTNASFTFTATETANFECQMDNSGYSACTSPKAYSSLVSNQTPYVQRAGD